MRTYAQLREERAKSQLTAKGRKGLRGSIVGRIGAFFSAIIMTSAGLSGVAHAIPGGYTWREAGTGVTGFARHYRDIASSADGAKLVVVDTGAASGGFIYTSTDYGVTWTERVSAGMRSWTSVVSSSDGAKLAATVLGGYIYTSTDSGVTWTERTSSGAQQWYALASSTDGAKLVAGADSTIYTSTDFGATWIPRMSSMICAVGIASSADGTKLAATDGCGAIYTSTDSGITWTVQVSAGYDGWGAIASSADGTKLVAAKSVVVDYIYTSSDSGVTWTTRTGAGYTIWLDFAMSADGTKIATAGGSLYSSNDSGATWIEQDTGKREIEGLGLIASSVDGARLAAAGYASSVYLGTMEGTVTTITIPFSTLATGNNNAPSSALSGATLSTTSMTCFTFNSGSVKTLGTSGLTAPEQNVNLLGGVAFDLTCATNGGSADVSLALNAHYPDTSKLRVYKQDPITKVMTDITSLVTLTNQLIDGQTKTVLTYNLVDGAALDEDSLANGTIVDPIYIGELATGSLASTGNGLWGMVVGGVILSVSAVVLLVGIRKNELS